MGVGGRLTLRLTARAPWARSLWRRTFGRILIFRVEDHSMEPTLRPGDWLLVDAHVASLPSPGDLVVVRDPTADRALVKRVRSRGRSTFAVGSDNPCSGRDSRHFGSLPIECLVGRVLRARNRV